MSNGAVVDSQIMYGIGNKKMSDKNSDNKEFAIKRITTPHGDVPTVDSVMDALNLIVSRINEISKNIDDRLKYSGATIEASGYIEQNLLDTNKKINELKNKLVSNSDQIENINGNVVKLDKVVSALENMTKTMLNGDFSPQTKSLDDIVEIKNMTKNLKESIIELQKSLGEGPIDLKMLYWSHEEIGIKEKLADIAAYESEKNKILSFFKILNLPKPVLDIDAKILVKGPSGTGKTSLIRGRSSVVLPKKTSCFIFPTSHSTTSSIGLEKHPSIHRCNPSRCRFTGWQRTRM